MLKLALAFLVLGACADDHSHLHDLVQCDHPNEAHLCESACVPTPMATLGQCMIFRSGMQQTAPYSNVDGVDGACAGSFNDPRGDEVLNAFFECVGNERTPF